MNALFQFLTAMVVALATMAFSHFGVAADGLELRAAESKVERSIKRSPVLSAQAPGSRVPG